MRNILIYSLFVSFLGCASLTNPYTSNLVPVTEEQKKALEKHNVSVEEYNGWKDFYLEQYNVNCENKGVVGSAVCDIPENIIDWIKNGFYFNEAKFWIKYNINAYKAKLWLNTGFKGNEAFIWIEKGFNEPSEAKKWKDSNFSSSEAMTWCNNNISLEKALFYKQNSISPTDALSWSKICNGKQALVFIKNNLTPKDGYEIIKKYKYGIENTKSLVFDDIEKTRGRCFTFSGNLLLQISSHAGLYTGEKYSLDDFSSNSFCSYDLSKNLFYLQFEKNKPPVFIQSSIVESLGSYKYRSNYGTYVDIPKLKVLLYY